ncbi:MAG: Mrp/NBP35 family ATP-binding protein [Oscillospiraceae bacterium]|nr:Mrp/NBP35 family ATP-binding protein [Oscillospiraceae bacterium]
MSTSCTKDCSSCGVDCPSRRSPQSFLENTNEFSHVKNVFAVVSGKGGVGKSLVTSLLAKETHSQGFDVAILDADITGPSIPKAFGIHERILGDGTYFYPAKSANGISVISLNLMLEDESSPAVWRGPIIAGTVKQFWTNANWGDVDYMFVDMPPGTGDVPLTVFQSLPISGIIIVTTPQDLVSMIVEKAFNMAKLMNIPVIALVENMSYLVCPDCGKKIHVFGESKVKELAEKMNVETYTSLPIDPTLTEAVDQGEIELVGSEYLKSLTDRIIDSFPVK